MMEKNMFDQVIDAVIGFIFSAKFPIVRDFYTLFLFQNPLVKISQSTSLHKKEALADNERTVNVAVYVAEKNVLSF